MKNAGIAIVGAGHGGSHLAASLRHEGYDGPITLISDELELPYHKPPLSKAFLQSSDAPLQLLRPESAYADDRITMRLGERVVSIDRPGHQLVMQGGSKIAFDKLVLATGARARQLRLEGHHLKGVFSLRTAADGARLRAALPEATNVVIIGGGYIGLEIAASLVRLGLKVTVIEAAERLLERSVAPEISEFLQDFHRSSGVRLILGSGVSSLGSDGKRVGCVVTSAGENIEADLVVVGIGAEPDVELAQAAGCACENGIMVGPDLQTSVPGVYAIGDCVRYHHWLTERLERLESVQNTTDQARHAAQVLVGGKSAYREVPWFWSDQGPVKLQMAGLAGGSDRRLTLGDPAGGRFSIYHFRSDALVAVHSVNRPAEHVLGRRLLASGIAVGVAMVREGQEALKALLTATPTP